MSDLEFWLKIIALGACAIFVLPWLFMMFMGAGLKRDTQRAILYEKPEDRPKPVMPPCKKPAVAPRLHCTNCGHGHNIIDLSTWRGGPL